MTAVCPLSWNPAAMTNPKIGCPVDVVGGGDVYVDEAVVEDVGVGGEVVLDIKEVVPAPHSSGFSPL